MVVVYLDIFPVALKGDAIPASEWVWESLS